MVAIETQLTLFVVSDEKPKKRVHNKIPTYRKCYRNDVIGGEVKQDNIWGEMQTVYKQIANYCPIPLFKNNVEYEDFDGVRVWYDTYTTDTYIHNATIYKGQEFSHTHAEIIGTERLPIEQRLKVHTLLLEQLRQGKTITEALRASFV